MSLIAGRQVTRNRPGKTSLYWKIKQTTGEPDRSDIQIYTRDILSGITEIFSNYSKTRPHCLFAWAIPFYVIFLSDPVNPLYMEKAKRSVIPAI